MYVQPFTCMHAGVTLARTVTSPVHWVSVSPVGEVAASNGACRVLVDSARQAYVRTAYAVITFEYASSRHSHSTYACAVSTRTHSRSVIVHHRQSTHRHPIRLSSTYSPGCHWHRRPIQKLLWNSNRTGGCARTQPLTRAFLQPVAVDSRQHWQPFPIIEIHCDFFLCLSHLSPAIVHSLTIHGPFSWTPSLVRTIYSPSCVNFMM
jgi:hypothetical protein